MIEQIQTWLVAHPLLGAVIGVAAVLLLAWLSNVVARRYILRAISGIVGRTQVKWDDALDQQRVFDRLANIAPALVVYYGVLAVPSLTQPVEQFVQRVASAVIYVVIAASVAAFLSAVNEIYARRPDARNRPIKGYVQIAKMFVFIVAAILVITNLSDTSPLAFLSGLGALTAVILLIFRDTILSFVASLQLGMNDMVRIGDWIEMPRFGADGDVVDIALHTVKVQNWDKTITTIPTHSMIADSFKNWRGMSESGGRRIKRAINIDMSSVRFLDPDEIARFGRWELLVDYVATKLAEIEEHNAGKSLPDDVMPHVRRLTNLGTFRAYVVNYLREHPYTHENMTLLVRQLEPTAGGLPLEIYVFSLDTNWVAYERIQSDIFDHLLSVLPEFGLRVYQQPSGADLRVLGINRAHADEVSGAEDGAGSRPVIERRSSSDLRVDPTG